MRARTRGVTSAFERLYRTRLAVIGGGFSIESSIGGCTTVRADAPPAMAFSG